MVEIMPVLDIRGGVAVCGRSGKRDEYRPLSSVYCKSSNPVDIIRALPFERIYVADLDGIVSAQPDIETFGMISTLKRVMVDTGIRDLSDFDIFEDLNTDIVLGTETLSQEKVVTEALNRFDGKAVVSVDIKDGGVLSAFLPKKPSEAYAELTELGVGRIIFLNISAVGTKKSDFSFIKDLNKAGEIILGGGITDKDQRFVKRFDVDVVLVGTALHKGLLDVKKWTSSQRKLD